MDQQKLVESNVALLEQAGRIVERLDPALYRRSVAGLPSLRAGAHLRHVIEFYECFFDGVERGVIDYGHRRRDLDCETSPNVALEKLDSLVERLRALPAADRRLRVAAEDVPGVWLCSTVCRELQALSSHTVHHYALIAVTLQAFGVEVPADFGVSPATLRYREAAA